MINAYDWEGNGVIDHVNAGAGQRAGETKMQVVDATEDAPVNRDWTTSRNNGMPGNGQVSAASAGQVNQTYVPFSSVTAPTKQLYIDFNRLRKTE